MLCAEAFELMRKEQHRHVQEQKQSLTKSGKSAVNLKHDENSLWDNPSHQSPPLSPVPKTAITPVPTPPRPAVPPGFSNVLQQRLNSNQTPLQQVLIFAVEYMFRFNIWWLHVT